MKFLTNWTIDLEKLANEKYSAFNGEFKMKLDYGVLKLCYESDARDAKGELIFNESRKKLLHPLINAVNKNGILKTSHKQRFGIGRYYAELSLSPICVSRHIKHTMFKYLNWIDLDMVKGHPSIIKQVASKSGFPTPQLDKYLADPKATFKTLIDYYSIDEPLTEDDVKNIFNIGIYGGSHECWWKALYDDGKGKIAKSAPHEIAVDFLKECHSLIDIVYLSNPGIADKVFKEGNDEWDTKKATMSYWCGAIENHIVHLSAKYLIKKKWIVPKSFAPEYDGICFERPNVVDEELYIMSSEINDLIKQKTGFSIKMIFKDYKQEKICQSILDSRKMWKMEDDKPIPCVTDEASETEDDVVEQEIPQYICSDDIEACDLVYESLKDRLIFSKGTLYFKKGSLWVTDESSIKSSVAVYVSKLGLSSMIEKKTRKGPVYSFEPYADRRGSWVSIANGVVDLALNNPNDEWHSKLFESSLGKILFKNGYWDFKQHRFFGTDCEGFDYSIVFVEHIPYDFKYNLKEFTEEELDYINSVKKRLFYDPFGEEIGDWYAEKLARGLAGDCQKNFLVGIGSSNTGKSIMTSACGSALGGYFGSYNGNNLKYKQIQSNDEAQALRWVMGLQYKRLIFSSELPMGFPIDANMMKKVSNGGLDRIVARGHGGYETEFKIGFLPVLFANDMNDIKPMDDAIATRLKCIDYKKVCVDEPLNEYEMKKDPNLGAELETDRFRNAFVWIMLHAYKDFDVIKKRIEIEPLGVKHAFNAIVGENADDIVKKFLNDFIITSDKEDFIKSSDIEEWLKGTQISMTKFGRELNKYISLNGIQNVNSFDKKIGGKTKKVWSGIRFATEDDDKV